MSDTDARMRKQSQNIQHTKKDANSKTSHTPTKNDGNQGSFQSSQSSQQPLLREREAEEAHEEDTAGCLCLTLPRLPHFQRRHAHCLVISLRTKFGTIHERNLTSRLEEEDALIVKIFAIAPGC
ncbi:hypothetical protein DSL72_009518 [Monilinia vaccinii-corymbosi]|uniref:Uncharacterized protein n=1 Tax=Monilinia vaccinii-corymbosi TaxID=61207 RepID=A0A8A3PQJ9_9HELO|nr:hypothetical protein DSL72_009518 [Monilinia vaccinii-corymbosi]